MRQLAWYVQQNAALVQYCEGLRARAWHLENYSAYAQQSIAKAQREADLAAERGRKAEAALQELGSTRAQLLRQERKVVELESRNVELQKTVYSLTSEIAKLRIGAHHDACEQRARQEGRL